MDTSHCLRRGGFVLLILVVFHSSVFGLASKRDGSGDSNDDENVKEWIVCTNQEPDAGPLTRMSCNKPGFVMTKINFADYGNPTGTCGHFRHGNCGGKHTMYLARKNCLGKAKCALLVRGEMFGPNHCEGAPTLAVEATCTKKA